ncbi:MAG: VWA domain-containing protein [Blastocatellia bacterium]|nr:VWA domain-containing protein [Blastocatellia bacterium]
MKLWMLSLVCILAGVSVAAAQANVRSPAETGVRNVILPVILEAGSELDPTAIAREQFELYDGGVPQQIEYFRPDYSPARIVVLVDNTERLQASLDDLSKAVKALAAHLYQGDQMMLVAYDEQPEVIEEFTDDRKKLQAGTALFRIKGSPRLLDAIADIITAVFRQQVGVTKRVLILISDGYDWQSKTPFNVVLDNLKRESIVVYVLQAADRTHGASRRFGPKPAEVVQKLTQMTGGRAFPLKDASDAAQHILQELAERWYQLSYKPREVNIHNNRRLLLIANNPKIRLRTRQEQPGIRF